MQKLVHLVVLLFFQFLPSLGQSENLPDSVMNAVYSKAFEYIGVSFPSNEIMVSYLQEDFEYSFHFENELTGKRKIEVQNEFMQRLNNGNKPLSDLMYSKNLYKLFYPHNQTISKPTYELWFGKPLNGLLGCTICGYNKHNAHFGIEYVYLFGYENSGNITLMLKHIVHLN